MRSIALGLIFLVAGLSGAALAQGPGSFARMAGPYGGPIRLDANFVASDSCQAALSANRGAPPGQSVAAFVVPVTIVIGPNPAGCGNSRVVRRNVTLGGSGVAQLVQIFFVNPAGRILKIEKVAIQSQ